MPTPADVLRDGPGISPGSVALAAARLGLRWISGRSPPNTTGLVAVRRHPWAFQSLGGGLSVTGGGTPPFNPNQTTYGLPAPRGEITRIPLPSWWEGPWGYIKRQVGKLPKSIFRGPGGIPGATAILVAGVLWDYLPDFPSLPKGPSPEAQARRRAKQGCRKHGSGWICPPGTFNRRGGTSQPPTALPGGAPAPKSPPPEVPASPPEIYPPGSVLSVPPEPLWKRVLQASQPYLPLLLPLLLPSGSKNKAPSVTTNISVPGFSLPSYGISNRDLTGIRTAGASLPGSGTGSKSCQCGPKKKRKPRDKRKVCYRGTYVETPTGLRKRRGKRVSCLPSRKRRP